MIPWSEALKTSSPGRTGIAPVHLLDLQDINGNCYYWASRKITAPSVIVADGGSASNPYLPWIVGVGVSTARDFGTGVRFTTADDAGAIGDWAQHEYRGYGFQLWMLTGAGQGTVNIFLDGVEVGTVNLATSSPALVPVKVFEQVNVPLDIHRVQVVQTLALPCSWYKLRVMR